MKVLFKYAFVLLSAAALLLPACTEGTDDGSYVAPVTLYEKIGGKWALTSIVQIDETAKVSGIKPDEMALTDQFGFGELKISFDLDASGAPASYAVTGTAPELFPATGYWDLVSEFPRADGTPPQIRLYADAARTRPTARLSVSSVPGASPTMELNLTRSAAGVPFVTYQYKLKSAN